MIMIMRLISSRLVKLNLHSLLSSLIIDQDNIVLVLSYLYLVSVSFLL